MSSLLIKEIELPPKQARALAKKARVRGLTPSEYVIALIQADLLADESFDALLRPIREDIRKRGITESDIERAVDAARHKLSAKRRTKK